MEYNKNVAEMKAGDRIQGFYLLRNIQKKMTNNGRPFLTASVSDATGSIDAVSWDYNGDISSADNGTAIKVQGTIAEYKNGLQFTIEKIRRPAEGDAISKERLIPAAPIDRDAWMDALNIVIGSMTDPEYSAICLKVLERHAQEIRNIPAALAVHHSFPGGLLMHTYNMVVLAMQVAELYSSFVDKDLLITGTMLHDIGKIQEFCVTELGLVSSYSTSGQLLGHLVMGAQEVRDICRELNISEEKSLLVQHMLLSHHGKPEFGAAVQPSIVEADLLSWIDMLDSRAEIFREVLEKTPVGTFSEKVFGLDRRIYNHSRGNRETATNATSEKK